MAIRFVNDSVKIYLARKGVSSVFGREVDTRERLSESDAIAWFDRVWNSLLAKEVEESDVCDIEFIRCNVSQHSQRWIIADATHKYVRLANCSFICQLTDKESCDQLWFIPSSSGDPRSLFIKSPTVADKEEFDKAAQELGWGPDEMGLKILRDFMDTVKRRNLGQH